MDNVTINISSSRLLGSRPRNKSKPKVFIAYRMNDESSIAMRDEIESILREDSIEVLTGQMGDGMDWAPEIRARIASCKLVIADVTGPSKEVLFEYGLAINKPTIPIIQAASDENSIPRWITARNYRIYGGLGTREIANSVTTQILSTGNQTIRNRPLPPPIAGRVTWIASRNTRSDTGVEVVRRLSLERGLDFREIYCEDLESPEDIRDVLRSWLTIARINCGPQDYIAHFAFGDIVARLRTGHASKKGEYIDRRCVAVCDNEIHQRSCLADSVRRVSRDVITILRTDEIAGYFEPTFKHFQKWRLGRNL